MDYSGNLISRIEDAVINTFFWAEELGHREELFEMELKNFNGSFKRRIVERINQCLKEDKSLTLLSMQIVDACSGNPNNEITILEIIAQNPLTIKMAKDYYAYLAMERIKRDLNVT